MFANDKTGALTFYFAQHYFVTLYYALREKASDEAAGVQQQRNRFSCENHLAKCEGIRRAVCAASAKGCSVITLLYRQPLLLRTIIPDDVDDAEIFVSLASGGRCRLPFRLSTAERMRRTL
ncbi:hypothetical protein TNIN_9151 [Trichonephila inaurata madagascariensis]|uniref:Uncharacterized protein n=1 Tax=Trichonephila inaurata madagascariensis TaxID=2747483 RepID=A0A8X6M607_9ARAC|nr:hypothetical protein TNIN_9151 [Trichonephila inaurata madagascariensis]